MRIAFWLTVFLVMASLLAGAAHAETMVASYYGKESGKQTASGARFVPSKFTAAHKSLPFGTRLHVCYRGCIDVVVNDRGPFIRGRDLDLSSGAASQIGLTSAGVGRVTVER